MVQVVLLVVVVAVMVVVAMTKNTPSVSRELPA
jgi:hypothetical protein